jgi:hypothetical protein
MTGNQCLFYCLIILAAIAKAVMDTIQFHFDESVFSRCKDNYFTNPKISWLNKYKDHKVVKGAKFLFSTTMLVWVTDLWHCMQLIFLGSVFYATVIYTPLGTSFIHSGVWLPAFNFVIIRAIFGIYFETSFRIMSNGKRN